MVLHFNVTGEYRRKMVKAIEQELEVKAIYLGFPSCAYKVGIFTVEKDGTLSWGDMKDVDPAGVEVSSRVVDACVMASGNHPSEWDENPVEDKNSMQMKPWQRKNLRFPFQGTDFRKKQLITFSESLRAKAGYLAVPLENRALS